MIRTGSSKGKNPSNPIDLLERFGRCYLESFERYLTPQGQLLGFQCTHLKPVGPVEGWLVVRQKVCHSA